MTDVRGTRTPTLTQVLHLIVYTCHWFHCITMLQQIQQLIYSLFQHELWSNLQQILLVGGRVIIRQGQLLMLWNMAECVSHFMHWTFLIPHVQLQFRQFFIHYSLPMTQVGLYLQVKQGFVVSIHNSVLDIHVAPPQFASLVNCKELLADDGPVTFCGRAFGIKTLHQVQLPICFLHKHGTNRIITLHVYEQQIFSTVIVGAAQT